MSISITFKHFVSDDKKLKLRIYDGKSATLLTLHSQVHKSNFRNGRFSKSEPSYLKLNRIIEEQERTLKDFKYECELRGYQPTQLEIKRRLQTGRGSNLIQYLELLKASKETTASVRKDLTGKIRMLGQYKMGNTSIPNSREKALGIVQQLEKHIRPYTIKVYLSYFRRATELAIKDGVVLVNHFAGIRLKLPKTVPDHFTPDELKALWSATGLTPYEDRARWVVLFLYYQLGLRVSEALLLKKKSVRGGVLYISQQKTGVDKQLPLQEVAEMILNKLPEHKGKYLFPLMDEKQQKYPGKSEREIYEYCRSDITVGCMKLTKKLGFKIHTHMGRHTFTKHSLEEGLPVQLISQVLGHTSLASTFSYTKRYNMAVQSKDIGKVYEKHLPEV